MKIWPMLNYNKNGINASSTALDKLANMSETTSLANINYNDLKILADKNAKGMLNTKSGIEDVLKENELSDFMRNYLSSLIENSKAF